MQTHLVTRTAAAAAAVVAAGLLSACGSSAGTGSSDSSTTTGTSGPATPSVTVTVTATQTSTPTLPLPTLSKPTKPNPRMLTPPPAKDPLVLPDTPRAYAQAFVTAWVDRDRPRAAKLAIKSAVDTAFASTVTKAPTFTTCEGAAGSSYCTWQGDEYTMVVRVGNERVAQHQEQAVQEVRFTH